MQHNAINWYSWCPEHWGTKWNASSIKILKNSITFKTAWNMPTPILQALIQKFKLTCIVQAIEDDYSFWLIEIYHEGKLITERLSTPDDKEPLLKNLLGMTDEAIAELKEESND
ncbi:hypothetical protein [Acinetobacter sp. P1(2025)]|uniref:DUF1281 family ferredoxin-like fold protein n=1 Tax=Acinetobacter sp. P1(2025) TaxID=3446120 RepID=UPI003F53B7B1